MRLIIKMLVLDADGTGKNSVGSPGTGHMDTAKTEVSSGLDLSEMNL